jgi:hypothetical protein
MEASSNSSRKQELAGEHVRMQLASLACAVAVDALKANRGYF